MVIAALKEAAEDVGINAFITNSETGIDTQLNKLTREEDLPIMLVSWDLTASVEFDANGYPMSPNFDAVILLLTKAEELTDDDKEEAAGEMSKLYVAFCQRLNSIMRVQIRDGNGPGNNAISNCNFQLVPSHGIAKHSGVLGRLSIKVPYKEIVC